MQSDITIPVSESPAIVSLVETKESVVDAVGAAMEAADWTRFIPAGCDVCIKPNLGWDLFMPGAVTSPLVVEGVIRKLKERVGKLYMVEANQVLVNCELPFEQTGMDRLCQQYDVEWINLSKAPFEKVQVPNPMEVETIDLPEVLTRTRLVTIPVMKTHNKTVLSGGIKNQWGCLPTFRHNFHPVLDQVLHDLTSVLRPSFTVLDGTVALEGNGPKSGRPRICNLVMASDDPVAVDTISAEVMQLDRFRIRHLEFCAAAGLGVHDRSKIKVVGEDGQPRKSVPTFDFETAHHNAVSWVETVLRGSFVRKLVFESPLLVPLCFGARIWYYIWYYVLKGRQLRDKAIRESPYGDQWKRYL